MGDNFNPAAQAARLVLADLCRAIREFLTSHSHYESTAEARFDSARYHFAGDVLALVSHLTSAGSGGAAAGDSFGGMSQLSFDEILAEQRRKDPGADALRRAYAAFSRLSVLNERLTARAGYSRGGEGGLSRTNQYLRYMMACLEELRMLRDYRTPVMMRYAVSFGRLVDLTRSNTCYVC